MSHAGEMGLLSLRRGADRLDWLGATYSGSGSTSAPPMLWQLDRNRRGIYCGANTQFGFV